MTQQLTQISLLKKSLKERFGGILPEIKDGNKSAEEIETKNLSRSLAAYALQKLSGLEVGKCAAAVTDDYNDNGIDAVLYDHLAGKFYFLQAKLKGDSPPDQGETKKFVDGVRDLLTGRYERFNELVQNRIEEIEDALERPGVTLVIVMAHTADKLGLHAARDIDDLIAELQGEGKQVEEYINYNLERAHGDLLTEVAYPIINDKISLENWNFVKEPYRTYYGQVHVSDLVRLHKIHGKGLFEKNIRNYLGSSDVNKAIDKTLKEAPDHLFFLNNGITAICDKIDPFTKGSKDKQNFHVNGFSVVNGAQTVGSIARELIDYDAALLVPGKILLTLIEVPKEKHLFGKQITEARNFQNRVYNSYFAALDDQQERIRRELTIFGIQYIIRPSADSVRSDDNIIKIDESAAALAAFSAKTDIVVTAKKEPSQLLDWKGKIYPLLFNEKLDSGKLVRYVRIFRFCNEVLTTNEMRSQGREKLFYRNGRYFIMHIFARKEMRFLNKEEITLSTTDREYLSRVLDDYRQVIHDVAEILFPEAYGRGYLAIFRSLGECTELARAVMTIFEDRAVQQGQVQ